MVNTFFWQAAILSILTSTAQARMGCDPLTSEKTCLSDPALGMAAAFSFSESTDSSIWSPIGAVNLTTNGAALSITRQSSTAWLQSTFYIYHGRYEAWLQGANSSGIDMSMFMLSDVSDEIAFTISSSNATQGRLQSISRTMNETYKVVELGVDTTADVHNYTLIWTEDEIQWYFDTKLMSTINSTALGDKYPKSPMLLGVDAGYSSAADRSNNAGSTAIAYFLNATVEDYTTGANYSYVNISGTTYDIEVEAGTSGLAKIIVEDGNQIAADDEEESSTNSSSSSSKHSSAPSFASSLPQTTLAGIALALGFLFL